MKPAFLPALLLTPAFSQNPYNEKPSYARSRDFDLRHIKLELSFDLPAKKLNGAATLGMAPLAGDLRELVLDSAALNIESVTAAGRPLAFHTADDKLFESSRRRWSWWTQRPSFRASWRHCQS